MSQHQIAISRVGQEGQGVGTDAEGNIYFVKGALPGDEVVVETTDAKKYRDADLLRVVTPSPERRESPCIHFQQCGGCDWLDWDYSAQTKAKQETLAHVLQRGSLKPKTFLPMQPAEQTLHYRNRIQLRLDGKRVGFYKKRSHDIVDIDRCVVADERLNDAIARLRAEASGPARKVEIWVTPEGKVEQLEDREHAAAGFGQVHEGQNEALKKLVRAEVQRVEASRVLELYCGNGNLSFAYLDLVKNIFGVDADKNGTVSANARSESMREKAAFITASVDTALERKFPSGVRKAYDTLIVDPPRQGMSDSLASFLHPKLRAVIYVSCSPVAFSKDVQCLNSNYTLDRVTPIDMFPQTRHIEFVATFLRSA